MLCTCLRPWSGPAKFSLAFARVLAEGWLRSYTEEKEKRGQGVDSQTVLLVEDFDADVFRFRCALSALNFPGRLRVAPTIGQARDYLEGREGYSDRAYYGLPSLIVSDLQFRGESGWQFLRWLRSGGKSEEVGLGSQTSHARGESRNTSSFAHIPVVVLSGVVEPIQHDLLLKEGAREVFEKTGDYAVMKGIVARILGHLPRELAEANGLALVPSPPRALTALAP